MFTLHGKRNFEGMIKYWEVGIILDYLGRPNLTTRVLKILEPFPGGDVTCVKCSERCNVTGFQDRGREPWAEEYEWSLGTG